MSMRMVVDIKRLNGLVEAMRAENESLNNRLAAVEKALAEGKKPGRPKKDEKVAEAAD